MLVLCISSGNGTKYGYPVPEKGVIYTVVEEHKGDMCKLTNSDIWYVININHYWHSSGLFEPLPDDFITNLQVNKLDEELVKVSAG